MKIDFLIVGPQKCGTTWLYENFKNHKALLLPTPPIKETRYFDLNYEKGSSFYDKFFLNSTTKDKIVGEFAPSYFDLPDVPDRVFKNNPRVKLIIGLRDPIALVESYYNHCLKKLTVSGSIKVAVNQNSRIISIAKYSEHITRWESLFPRKQIFYYHFSQIINEPQSLIEQIAGFLGIDKISEEKVVSGIVNQGYQPKFKLIQFLRKSVYQLLKKRGYFAGINMFRKLAGSIYSSNKKKKTHLASAEVAWLEELLFEEIEFVSKMNYEFKNKS